LDFNRESRKEIARFDVDWKNSPQPAFALWATAVRKNAENTERRKYP